jgi:hypothetical protein
VHGVHGLDKGQSNAPPATKFIQLSQSAKSLFLKIQPTSDLHSPI